MEVALKMVVNEFEIIRKIEIYRYSAAERPNLLRRVSMRNDSPQSRV